MSIGIALHGGTSTPDGGEIATLLADSDAAMYAAKLAGRGTVHVFETADRDTKQDPATIAPALRTAALNDEIRMMVQPIVDLADERVSSFESLVRWDLPEVGRLSPADFLQTAEEGAIVEIGHSILRQTLDFARGLPDQMSVSVSVSWTELAREDYPRPGADRTGQCGDRTGPTVTGDPASPRQPTTPHWHGCTACGSRRRCHSTPSAGSRWN